MKNRSSIIVVLVSALIINTALPAFAGPRQKQSRNSRHRQSYKRPEWYMPVFLHGLAHVYYHKWAHRNPRVQQIIITQPVASVPVTPQGIAPAPAAGITVNIPTTTGSYAAVVLNKSGSGYTGPQGEYYPLHPTVEQLQILYGN